MSAIRVRVEDIFALANGGHSMLFIWVLLSIVQIVIILRIVDGIYINTDMCGCNTDNIKILTRKSVRLIKSKLHWTM